MEVFKINLFDLYAKISLDSSDYESGIKEASSSGESFANKLKSGLSTAGSVAAKGLGVVTGAATAVGGALLALEASTEEYRIAQGKLNTAFENNGYSAETAQQAYKGFYEILGDTDTATEASQLLARLAQDEQDVAEWTRIAAGVAGTFGDALPIESLIEASNETAKVGQVTGTLADALNWMGISEDTFNEKLAETNSQYERSKLIMETLEGVYVGATEAFYENNEAIIQARDNQVLMQQAMGELGETVTNVKNDLISGFMPAVSSTLSAFNDMLTGVEGADQEFSKAIQSLVDAAVQKLPAFLDMGVQILTSLVSGIVQAIPSLVSALPQVITSIIDALTQLLPQILNVGVQLLDQFTSGIESGLPDMIGRIPVIIEEFLNYITENLPTILEKGVEVLNSLVNGVLQAIPEMVARLPEIITAFTNFITTNLPTIVNAGVNILVNLATGIIQAIPQMVSQIPQIITAFTNAIASAIPQIIQAGVQMLTGLADGVIQNIPAIVAAVPQIISSFIGAFDAHRSGIINIGKNIVSGVWEGITGMIGWFTSKVTSFFSGIVNSAKNALDIHSPSRVFADIGKNMALGVGVGWDGEYAGIKKDIDDGLNFSGSATLSASGIGYGGSAMGGGIGSVNITVNGAKYSNERQLAKAIAEEIQNMTNRKAAVYA